jgi:hypothetical protein
MKDVVLHMLEGPKPASLYKISGVRVPQLAIQTSRHTAGPRGGTRDNGAELSAVEAICGMRDSWYVDLNK